MNTQRGSILVGVISISLAMTLAAGGFILIASNSIEGQYDQAADETLHYAAESGIYTGAGWIKRNRYSTFYPSTWPNDHTLTIGTDGFSASYQVPVKVSIHRITSGPGLWLLKSIATAGPGKDTLQITWRVNSVVPDTGDPLTANAIPVLSEWKETYISGTP